MYYVTVGSGVCEGKMPQLRPCEVPRQVRWTDFDSETRDVIYGIQFDDKIICACCGGIFPIEELNELGRKSFCTNWVEVGEEWVSFSDEMAYNW